MQVYKLTCVYTCTYVFSHIYMYIIFVHILIIHDAFFSLTYLFSHINRLEMEQMLFNCYKIISIGLKKEQQFVSFTLSCSVSLAAQSVWSMLELRLSFFNSSVAGLSQYFTVLSRIAFQLWSSSGEIHPDVQRFVSSRTTALKGFHDGYKGEKLSRLRDFSEGLDTYKYVQMISDRDVLRKTLGSSMLRYLFFFETKIRLDLLITTYIILIFL